MNENSRLSVAYQQKDQVMIKKDKGKKRKREKEQQQ
jgi:hypothetical protein